MGVGGKRECFITILLQFNAFSGGASIASLHDAHSEVFTRRDTILVSLTYICQSNKFKILFLRFNFFKWEKIS